MVACCRVKGIEYDSASMGPFEGGHHYLHYLHHSLASGQATGREHRPAFECFSVSRGGVGQPQEQGALGATDLGVA